MSYAYLILSYVFGLGTMYGYIRLKTRPHDGQMVVTVNDEGKMVYVLELNGDPADLQDQEVVSFKVTTEPDSGYHDPE
jgi:hypothetical protein